jgi:hypothetical protein
MKPRSKQRLLSCLFLVCSFAPPAVAANQLEPQRWERNEAMAAVRSVNTGMAVYELGDDAALANGPVTINRLINLETREDWPLPAREAAIYRFTRSLADLPRDAVATVVMQHLQNYQARTLVPHEDHADALVPLFNIRSAAKGVENGWQRLEFADEAATLIGANPVALVTAFTQSANPGQRSGYLDALRSAGMADVMAVQDIALGSLADTPSLTGMIAVTAVITADEFAIQQLLIDGRGAGLAAALKQLDEQLGASETASLLEFAVQEAPAPNASLAIAAWWPRLKHDPATRDLLIDALADPELGASAALALARAPDIQTISDLQRTANGDSTAAKRAQMALDIGWDGLIGDSRP